MSLWIFLRTADKLPLRRGRNKSAFEDHISDPNMGSPFGPSSEYMFVPVIYEPTSNINKVTHKRVPFQTAGVDQDYRGKYVDPNWVIGWDVVPTNITEARQEKKSRLYAAARGALDEGFVTGGFQFPFTEDFFSHICIRKLWMDGAIADGVIPANTQITFSDIHNKEVKVNLNQLQNAVNQYGKAYQLILEKRVRAEDEIEVAITPEQVDSVIWNFA